MSHQEREKLKTAATVRKVRGQLDAVERSLAADEDCGGQTECCWRRCAAA